MLNNKEKMVMAVIYELCEETGTCLVRPVDILKAISYKKEFTRENLQEVMQSLMLDEYFELIVSDNKGELTYCIKLLIRGEAFKRSMVVFRRTLAFKLLIGVVLAVISVIVPFLIKFLFL